ncbi:MAG: dihydropteroate synthase [gamma proteobacterium symbiont of Bathyaustriella thionipta]|nr:dihydropteroate synthase [gamma proteobacterium symbiont of Bathyaustriella thionipta]MCU7948850.1 dihydropteroate synthase [gamma proteobacterium symbiont of Bathyaustriella thionipta]MCU7951941.1 dihydropteroate synthase [gamma proteobacterium symbiont of Bathyaustriella thionipta]MCU7955424.1 dihydropteroate synthase [gamma proteobacterium symbiont of Bathyaustriella thionipta]MCU7965759.1 dihydropteroate synthase [gamma proteobacterium symbiont of Bathyaustriella thionipta]
MTKNTLQCADRELRLDSPVVMGILNVTPDSFSDDGLFSNREAALRQAEKMVADGALVIDIGGESTRPGAKSVSDDEELDRVVPVIEKIHQELDVIISIDTSKAIVMKEAASAGAGMLNDVMALRADGALKAAQETGLPVCLMHMKGEPRTMQSEPVYDDVFLEVKGFLTQQIERCLAQGFKKEQIIIDPGFGFGKTLAHNVKLFKHINAFTELNLPVLVGASRKSMIGQITGRNTDARLAGSLALATLAAISGAAIIRVHDVAETVDAIKIANALY